MSREAGVSVAPAFGEDLDLVADLRGLLARDVPLAFDFVLLMKLYLFFCWAPF